MNVAASSSGISSAPKFQSLIEVDMEIGAFTANWGHCDRLSSYVARMISHNRKDSLLYANLFSSVLNELLETIFRTHEGSGQFVCAVQRMGRIDRVVLTLPYSATQLEFYRDTIAKAHRKEAPDVYREMLFSSANLDPRIGLFELAVDYGAEIAVQTVGETALELIADLALEDGEA